MTPPPTPNDQPPVCPECAQGKPANCTGWALDEADVEVECATAVRRPVEDHPLPTLAGIDGDLATRRTRGCVVGDVLTARYPGRCHNGCGESIEPGDDIRMTDDGAIHTGCTPRPEVDPLAARHPVCTTCWLSHPPGACDRL